jgi:2-hydroxychromene-2-carboxylate isomerase
MAQLDFWFDFASTYSYPAAMRIGPLAQRAGVTVRYRPFLLGPIFKSQGWENSPFNLYEAKGRYMWRDLERLCADLGLPFRKPDPFPQHSLLAARVALAIAGRDRDAEFCRAVFDAEFGEGKPINEPSVMDNILRGLNLDPRETMTRAQSGEIKTRLRLQTEEAVQLGIFGAPSFVAPDGELFWGNDRLEQALNWAARKS